MSNKKTINSFNKAVRFLTIAALTLTLLILTIAPASANNIQEAMKIMDKSSRTLDNFIKDPNLEGFSNLLKNAMAVVIAPSLLKGAFVVGVSGGNAVAMVRDEKTGNWSAPAFYSMGGASFGLQIGGQASEVILLAMTKRGALSLLTNSFKLGADAGVAAGPVGIGAQAATANLSADILSFSRSKGLYGGISLDGAVIAVREDLNEAYYNKPVSTQDVFVLHSVNNPYSDHLISKLKESAD